MTDHLDIVVGVLTFKRPEALRLTLVKILEQVRELDHAEPSSAQARIVVIDNDPAGSARSAVESLAAGEITYVIESLPGISAGRNRALDEGHAADLLVFIDDDETPLEKWLSSLIETWQVTRATAVMGRVISTFDSGMDPWIEAGNFFWRPSMPSGTPIQVAAAGNLLLDMHQVVALGVRFDPAMGLTGGEDTLFSRMIINRGGRIVWCDESAATDHVPESRLTKKWVLTRAWSHGNTATLVELKLSASRIGRSLVRARALVKGASRLAGGSLRTAYGCARRDLRHRARGRRAMYRGAGLISGAVGIAYLEYARGSRWQSVRRIERGPIT